jgi:uncharacterized phiE125 gp8 family phage protein
VQTLIERLTEPTAYSLNADEVERHLQVGSCEEYVNLKQYIRQAEEYIESKTSRAIMEQQFRESFDCFPFDNGQIDLTRYPLSLRTAPVSTTYWDTAGIQQTLSSLLVPTYKPLGTPPFVKPYPTVEYPDTFDRLDAVQVTYWAGYQTASEVSATVKQAVGLLVDHAYENRTPILIGSSSKELEFSLSSLINTLKIGRYAA